MSRAYQCDRCGEYRNGMPDYRLELRIRAEGELVDVCWGFCSQQCQEGFSIERAYTGALNGEYDD